MRERPILFKPEMVRAILEGRKTQTRRIVTVPPWLRKLGPDLDRSWPDLAFGATPCLHVQCANESVQRLRNPWGWPNDRPLRLWVKETWRPGRSGRDAVSVQYAADGALLLFAERDIPMSWRQPKAAERGGNVSPLLMPRWASRLTLEVTDVRVERAAWSSNPWVWVVSFRPVEKGAP